MNSLHPFIVFQFTLFRNFLTRSWHRLLARPVHDISVVIILSPYCRYRRRFPLYIARRVLKIHYSPARRVPSVASKVSLNRLVRASLSLSVCLCMSQSVSPVHNCTELTRLSHQSFPVHISGVFRLSSSNAINYYIWCPVVVFSLLCTKLTSSSLPSISQPFCFTITALIYHTVTTSTA